AGSSTLCQTIGVGHPGSADVPSALERPGTTPWNLYFSVQARRQHHNRKQQQPALWCRLQTRRECWEAAPVAFGYDCGRDGRAPRVASPLPKMSNLETQNVLHEPCLKAALK